MQRVSRQYHPAGRGRWGKTATRLLTGSDFLVKIVHAKDTSRVSLLSDNTKAVRSAAWDPSGKYLVTAGCDGKIKIYDTSGSTPVCVKIMEGVIAPSEAEYVQKGTVALPY